ncbi:hypothetical protein COLO4_28201 [Corchorus olitorius]|uniref:Glycosyltransferase family 92 protein n=1 Tax=Corchorus olitorius TaxID=93759 RepID=A0A1R3HMM5_9ROSI|nr:hypothetical protein COLO4_28201 [Corchorus olitorius]
MRKEAAPSSVPSTAVTTFGKLCVCFETKPLVSTLLAITLVMLIWNLPPYYQTLLSTARPCSATPLTSAAAAVATTSLLTTNATLPFTATPVAEKKYYTAPKAKPTDPNKRVFEAYGNAAALFVHMGAYRGGPTTAKAYKILPDWGYGRVYTVVVVNCTFPFNPNQDNLGGKLMINAYYGESPRKYEKFTALEEAPGSYDESKYHPPYKYEYLYCGSSLYGNLSADRMREWMAYHAWFFGPSSHFVLHDAGGVTAEVRAALDPWVRAGRVTVQDIRDQAEYDGYYYNQFLIVNDCLHRYRHAANWTFFFDVDEYIYLPDGNTLESVLNEFSNYTQFTIEQNPTSSVLCLNDSSQQYSRTLGLGTKEGKPTFHLVHLKRNEIRLYSWQWGFEKLLFRESRTGIRRDRKYAIQAKNAYATGVHMSENVVGKALHKTETQIRYYHYHNTITVHEELCRELLPLSAKNNVTWFNKLPYVYDDNMKKLVKNHQGIQAENHWKRKPTA